MPVRRRGLSRMLVAIAFLVTAPGAGATGWALQQPVAPVARQGVLSAVACTSATACTAVGYRVNPSGATVSLAERWNGTSWGQQATPNPAGTWTTVLKAVSCGSASACVAVGYSVTSTGASQGLVEQWNGTSWGVVPAPVPSGASSSVLSGVSCTSATACTAVGQFVDFFGTKSTLAAGWNGTTWSIEATSLPAGATSAQLTAVSCSAATACTAAGAEHAAGGDVTLAERWDGAAWTVQSTPNPAGAAQSALNAISCPTSSACTAAGSAANTAGTRLTLVETWNGTAWTIATTPNPGTATTSILRGIACASASACSAVGYDSAGSAAPQPLAERWNGTSWTIVTAALGTGSTSGALHGVSCTAATACLAAGYQSAGLSRTLAESWNGAGWTVRATVNPAGAIPSELHGVTCSTATSCMAAGYASNGAGSDLVLAESWNGTAWSRTVTPSPAGEVKSTFNGIACAASTACTAIGYGTTSAGVEQTLAESWNGTGWTLQTTPNPTGARDSLLAAAACTSTSACIAVGNEVTSADVRAPLAERSSGSTWTIQPTPSPAGAMGAVLRGVACPTASACMAVGTWTDSSGVTLTLAEQWNGSSWTVLASPSVGGASTSALENVSCTAANACTAVGYSAPASGSPAALAERWNGSSWTIQTVPVPSGATGVELSGVSCAASTACTAAGHAVAGGGADVPLTEAWNGTSWTVQALPAVPGASAGALDGVWCTAATVCTASGFAERATSMPLAMRES